MLNIGDINSVLSDAGLSQLPLPAGAAAAVHFSQEGGKRSGRNSWQRVCSGDVQWHLLCWGVAKRLAAVTMAEQEPTETAGILCGECLERLQEQHGRPSYQQQLILKGHSQSFSPAPPASCSDHLGSGAGAPRHFGKSLHTHQVEYPDFFFLCSNDDWQAHSLVNNIQFGLRVTRNDISARDYRHTQYKNTSITTNIDLQLPKHQLKKSFLSAQSVCRLEGDVEQRRRPHNVAGWSGKKDGALMSREHHAASALVLP